MMMIYIYIYDMYVYIIYIYTYTHMYVGGCVCVCVCVCVFLCSDSCTKPSKNWKKSTQNNNIRSFIDQYEWKDIRSKDWKKFETKKNSPLIFCFYHTIVMKQKK